MASVVKCEHRPALRVLLDGAEERGDAVRIDGRIRRGKLCIRLSDKRLRAGQRVIGLLGAANRDPAAFENPEALDIGCNEKSHLSFGRGIH